MLANQIRSGEVSPGTWLPSERQLAEAHQVSRTTARAALHMLATWGLATLVTGSGVQVNPTSTTSAADDVDLRGELGTIREQLAEIMVRLSAIESQRQIGEPTQ